MRIAYVIVAIVSLFLGLSYYLGYTPPLIALLILCLSLVSYFYYAKDKKAALTGAWRVPENTLQLLSLAGGWPGAIIAQQGLRHKTKKVSFRLVFGFAVLANVGGLVWLHSGSGQITLQGIMRAVEKGVNGYVTSDSISTTLVFLTALPDKR
ncbi:DUF1294 domain-containing protein [Zhongshania arctica]|uniref:DUF1294 domain-containing protein n=1 Tax=Zhongshania arctica TaxID=3238302 RepID=A0ABV3TY32_9GAMM